MSPRRHGGDAQVATRIREWQKHADVYAYFNDDWRGHAVKEAIRLRELA